MSCENYDCQIKRKSEAGNSLIDVLIVITVLAIVLSFAMVKIAAARDGLRLTNSAQVLSAYLEKARLAAIRCHCSPTIQANMPTDLSDGATDSYVTHFANNNTNTAVVVNPKNHKKPKK